MLRTRFTDMFDLDHPVMSAPMALHSGGTLASAVSAAGGMGSFGGIRTTEGPEWVGSQVELIRASTDRPFAIGFITPFLTFTEPFFDAALAARPAAIALSFSDPSPWAARVKEAGARLICQVQTLADADLAVSAGADVLVAQGNEAGGHTGTMGLLPLLTAMTGRHPATLVLAAGGVADGRALAAALMAGADGAWMGTAFLATPEAVEIDDDYKEMIVASDGGDTVFTRAYDIASGAPWPRPIGERVRRDAFTDAWTDREAELRADPAAGQPGQAVRYGQSAWAVREVRSAADVLRSVCAEAERALHDRPASLLG